MNRPRIRFDGLPLWPAGAAAVIGAGMVYLGYAIAKVVELVDDARAEL
ncbi:hypothetical protein GCM10028801_41400 [Nocardioides maradonensis]